jgi:hypothetical protein
MFPFHGGRRSFNLNHERRNKLKHLISVVTDKQRALKNATGLFHSWSKDCIYG